MKAKLVDWAYKFVLTDPRYKWLAGTGTYDNPLGPVNPRSEESYKAALAAANSDILAIEFLFRGSQKTIEELREEQRGLRAIIDKQDRAKYVKENFR